jgi:hypothetical protein
MAPPTGTQHAAPVHHTTTWGDLPGPGAWISRRTGRLYRVPASALEYGYGPVIPILGPDGEEIVTRLSDDAYEPVANLRRLAAEASIAPAF